MSKFALFTLLALFVLLCDARKLRHDSALNKGLAYRYGHNKIQSSMDTLPAEQWFAQQRVNHFNLQNTDVWSQRYFVNDTFWSPNGPIFLVLGGEGPISANYVLDHFVTADYAKKFGALMVGVEHRFYGKSIPYGDLSTENLRLLSSEQALADFAVFRNFIVDKFNAKNSKVITFGGSYSGSLSAWMRTKYPHLIDGAIATSAPVLALLDFPEYKDVVADSIGPVCTARIRNATNHIASLLKTPNGRNTVETAFQTCSPIETEYDIATFMDNLEGGIAEIVQYNDDNNGYLPFNMDKMCSILLEGGSQPSDAMAAYANFNSIFNKFSGSKCTEASYDDYITQMKDVRPYPDNDNAAGRAWTYQTCVEFGYYQTGSSARQPFSPSVTLQYFLDQCRDIFGITELPNVDWTNINYGGLRPTGSKIIFPNGSVDPWHALGILRDVTAELPAFFMKGTAHCADLYPPSNKDLPDLVACRKREIELISEWIA